MSCYDCLVGRSCLLICEINLHGRVVKLKKMKSPFLLVKFLFEGASAKLYDAHQPHCSPSHLFAHVDVIDCSHAFTCMLWMAIASLIGVRLGWLFFITHGVLCLGGE